MFAKKFRLKKLLIENTKKDLKETMLLHYAFFHYYNDDTILLDLYYFYIQFLDAWGRILQITQNQGSHYSLHQKDINLSKNKYFKTKVLKQLEGHFLNIDYSYQK